MNNQYFRHSEELYDRLSECWFTVSVDYYPGSIESYELEGDNISREELVKRFGERQVKELEEVTY